MSSIPIEIERKYIIRKPRIEALRSMDGYYSSEILQIYLTSNLGVTHRIRAKSVDGKTVYTETKKIRIDEMSAYEDEKEICVSDFQRLSHNIMVGTRGISKIRHTFNYLNQKFEIDVYPEWKSTCIMETELQSRNAEVEFPDFVEIIEEVTGKKAYSNASMSKSFPQEKEI